MPARDKAQAPSRIRIEHPTPTVDSGRWPVKRTTGDMVQVSADIFRDGHEVLRAVVRWRGPEDGRWRESELYAVDAHHDGVRWEGAFPVDTVGTTQWTIQAWVDVYAGWRSEIARKLEVGQPDLSGELSEGAVHPQRRRRQGQGRRRPAPAGRGRGHPHRRDRGAAPRPRRARRQRLGPRGGDRLRADARDRRRPPAGALRLLVRAVPALLRRLQGRAGPAAAPGRAGLRRPLPAADPPDRPHEPQGPQQHARRAGPDDPGSPYAIGDETGGHDAIHPELGTEADFVELVRAANALDIDVALDLAVNCSPDHPWLTEHPEWFYRRPDGTLKYAENPPKKYQDIYNVDFGCEDWRGLWEALLEVVRHWVELGVTVFRVDNPHTKPFGFWEWLIKEIRDHAPGHDLPGRGVHPPRGHARAGQARLRPELHVLHVEEQPLGAQRVRRRAGALRGARVLPAELLPDDAGHPHRRARPRRPAEVRQPPAPGRDAEPVLRRCTPATSTSRACSARAARSSSTTRSTS